MRRRRASRSSTSKRRKRGGGLCAWLGRKHRWSHAKVVKCQNKANRRRRGRRRRYTRTTGEDE